MSAISNEDVQLALKIAADAPPLSEEQRAVLTQLLATKQKGRQEVDAA